MAASRPGPGQRAATSILTGRWLGARIDCPRCVLSAATEIGDYRVDFAGRRPRLGHECGPPVELQFADGFVDIGQRPVGEALDRLTVVNARVPAPAELFD